MIPAKIKRMLFYQIKDTSLGISPNDVSNFFMIDFVEALCKPRKVLYAPIFTGGYSYYRFEFSIKGVQSVKSASGSNRRNAHLLAIY